MKMFQDDNPIPYEDLYEGMEVRDKDGNVGTIKEIMNSHNILVEYTNGGSGLYCTEEKCEEFDTYFDPLYKP